MKLILNLNTSGRQFRTVFELMRDEKPRTLRVISDITGYPETSISARLRDFRKEEYGAHWVEENRIIRGRMPVREYKLIPNPHCEIVECGQMPLL